MHKTFLITIILIFGMLFSDPFEPLNTDFLKHKKKKDDILLTQPPPQKIKKGDLPAYEEIIKDFELIEGLFSIYWDKINSSGIRSSW